MALDTEETTVARTAKESRSKKGITVSSTAEYFSKNLQQVGFSSPTKAVLTTVKEAFDNSMDACEENGILPDIRLKVKRLGNGSLKNTEKLRVIVEDNGPGIEPDDIAKVFGEYLASSKFGRGRCTRGQQGIGISAATTWALQTNATGAQVVTKTKSQRKATSCVVEMDLKNNKGVLKNKETLDWDRPNGTSVEFVIDGRVQLNGEAGLINYIKGNVLVNPHLKLTYQLPDMEKPETIDRVSEKCPEIPEAIEPHPHTMKLGEFIAHARLFGTVRVKAWLKKGFSRVSDKVIEDLIAAKKVHKDIFEQALTKVEDKDFKALYEAIQSAELMSPSTTSVVSIGEAALSESISRLGDIDFFSVVSRKPTICDYKPIQVEVAIARLQDKKAADVESEDPAQVLRFANRVPLQFDKSGCAIVKAINTINWRNYGLRQPKESLPLGPYIIAVSIVSPFIKFKNASKETIDASDELVEEIRRALMQAGQRLSRHIRRENKESQLEERIAHIQQFGPILVETLARIVGAPEKRKAAATEGLLKILGKDARETKSELANAEDELQKQKEQRKKRLGKLADSVEEEDMGASAEEEGAESDPAETEEAVDAPEVKAPKPTKKEAPPRKQKK